MIVQNNIEAPQPKRAKIGRFELVKKLKKGRYSKVKLGIDPVSNEQFAFKIISEEHLVKKANEVERELNLLAQISTFSHENIIRVIKYDDKGSYTKKNGTSKKAFIVSMEYASNGELFSYLASNPMSLTEELARTFFHQLIEAVEFLHDQSVAHGDIRPENILLDSNFNIKLADFSYSGGLTEKFDEKKARDRLSVYNYAPPEVHLKEDVDLRMIDLFTCGIVLFLMVTGASPFERAHPSERLFKLLISNNSEQFWKTFEKGSKHYSSEFKQLISCMLAFEPIQRLSLAEIKSHPWYNGTKLSLEDLKKEFIKKIEAHNKHLEKLAEEERKKKEKLSEVYSKRVQPMLGAFNGIKPPTTRSGCLRLDDDDSYGNSLVGVKTDTVPVMANQYVNAGFKELTEIFLAKRPEVIYKQLGQMASSIFNSFKISDKSYKIHGVVLEQDYRGSFEVEVTRVNEQLSCVIFNRIDGDLLGFYKVIDEKFRKQLSQ